MLPGRKYTPQDIIQIVTKRWWLLVAPPLVCGFLALLYSRTQQDIYEADALIQVISQRVPNQFVTPTITTRIEERLAAISQEIRSRTRLEQVIQEFDLYPVQRVSGPIDDVIEKMRAQIQILPSTTSPGAPRPRGPNEPVDAFRVKFAYGDPDMALKVTQRLASSFVVENTKIRNTQAEATSDFLDAQLQTARANLQEQERKLELFNQRYSGSLPSQQQANLQQIQTLQLQLNQVVESVARDRDRKLTLEQIHQGALAEPPPPPPVTSPGQTSTAPLTARQQLDSARLRLAEAQLRLTPDHPDIRRLKSTIADLEKAVEKETTTPGGNQLVAPATNPYESQRRERIRQQAADIESLGRQITFKEAEERRLRAEIGSYQGRLAAVPGLQSELTALTRDYETVQTAYKDLLQKSQSSKVAEDLEQQQIGEQFRILDEARVSTQPVSSARLQINIMGVVLGIVLGLALIALLELVNTSFRTEADVVNAIALPVLAQVQRIVTAADRDRVRRTRLLASLASGVAMVVAGAVFWRLQLWKFIA